MKSNTRTILLWLLPWIMALQAFASSEENRDWFVFDPKPDAFTETAAMDLRFLNEKFAGENGHIAVKDGNFVHSKTGRPVRFWAVNGPPHDLRGDELRRCAMMLAKHGVNMVRIHGGYFNDKGEVVPAKVKHAMEIVEVMKAAGIYTHFSIYFPLWIKPPANTPWLTGYDGNKHPFASLLFNPDFQEQYRQWWSVLLTTRGGAGGRTLLDEPAVFGLELQNEDSFFFWTFDEKNIPDAQLRILESRFAAWLAKKYGSLEASLAKWNQQRAKRDAPEQGRMGFRPLWNMFSERSLRDQDTAAFLLETQTGFYADTVAFLRKLGFKGMITASNWTTASPETLGPLEKLSYTTGDFIDRHGYFGNHLQGDNSAWSIRNGHTYADRSAYRFDPEKPGETRQFFHPAMDPHYQNLPSMISETTWCRPNRFRSEAPLYYAAYGALQHSDAIVHFALDSAQWAVKPGYFMQPWTLMTPSMMGQFPAAAMLYRRGLVTTGALMAEVNLNKDDLVHLKGTPMPQGAELDELRLQDIPQGAPLKPGQHLNSLLHFVGRSNVNFVSTPASSKVADLRPFLDLSANVIRSSTRELTLNYASGVLTIDAARVQGWSGCLKAGGASANLKDLSISSDMDLGHIIVLSLDDKPLQSSARMLLQVMSEEKATNFQTEPVSQNLKRIVNIGTDPWLVRNLAGSVRFKRPDAGMLEVTALDFNGYPVSRVGTASEIRLQPQTLYYLIVKPQR